MSAYISGDELPVVIEFVDASVRAVADEVKRWMREGRVREFSVVELGESEVICVAINFGLLTTVLVGRDRPDERLVDGNTALMTYPTLLVLDE